MSRGTCLVRSRCIVLCRRTRAVYSMMAALYWESDVFESLKPSEAYIYINIYIHTHIYIYTHTNMYIFVKWIMPSLAQTMTCRLFAIESLSERDWETETSLTTYTDAWYQTYMAGLHVSFSTNLISNTSLHVGRPLLRPCLVAYAEAILARQKYSATNEKCWHHFRILIVDKWSFVWNECNNREFLLTGWKSLWSLATWLVISDSYIGEVILQLSIEAMVSHSNSNKPLPQLRGLMLNCYRFPVDYISMEFSFIHSCEKMILKLMSGKYQPHYFGSNVLWSQLCIFEDSRRNGILSVPAEKHIKWCLTPCIVII